MGRSRNKQRRRGTASSASAHRATATATATGPSALLRAIPPLWTGVVLFGLFAASILATAWLSDDAYILLRQVVHFLEGRGIVFNPGMRVQGFSDPLWFLLLSGVQFITREHFFTTIFLSTALSLGAIALLLNWGYRHPASRPHAGIFTVAVPLLLLLCSYSFIDFATSGMENCLSYLLFALLIYLLFSSAARPSSPPAQLSNSRLYLLALLCAGIFLTRFDHALLLLPVVLYALTLYKTRLILPLLLGGGIVLLWLAFSTFYFGSPLPNTYYAKLGTGWSLGFYLSKGVNYYGTQLGFDPLALLLIALGLYAGFKQPATQAPFARWLAAGVVLYLVYLLRIGGDFMQGRYFAVPMVISAFLLASYLLANPSRIKRYALFVALCLPAAFIGVSVYEANFHPISAVPGNHARAFVPPPLFAHLTHKPTVILRNRDGTIKDFSDERRYYWHKFGLFGSRRDWPYPQSPIQQTQIRSQGGHIGELSLRHGHQVWFVDFCGLADPLVSRLPANPNGTTRIGHQEMRIPAGYFDSISSGTNQVRDPRVRALYADVNAATRGGLFAKGRWDAILRLNTHDYGITVDYE